VAQAFAPFGLRNVANMGSHGNEIRQYPLPNGVSCANLGRGSPVKFNNGTITSLGTGGGPILGVAHGFAYIDPTTKRLTHASQIPAGTSSGGLVDGESRPIAYITDSAEALFMVQADATVSQTDFGLNFDVTASGGDVDQVYGVSRYALKASSRSSAIGLPCKIVGIAKIIDNAWNDPYPIVVVKLNTIMAQVSAA
jgi:hypothetical protein